MAKISINGNAVVIRSDFTVDELKMVQKYRPESLSLKDEDGEPTFVVNIRNGNGSVGAYGVSFPESVRGEEKPVIITQVPEDVDEPKDYVVDTYGSAILNLIKVEGALGLVLDDIRAERNSVVEAITVER